jgi:antitoxin component YwqK of YwqJK toxin-antitoxin module
MQIPLINSVVFPIFTISNNQIKETDMKLIITVLLLTVGAFAQNTTYKNGTNCKCDSIVREYESGHVVSETPYLHGTPTGIKYTYYLGDVAAGKLGQVHMKIPLKNGKFNGVVEEYQNDTITWSYTWKMGIRHGFSYFYHKNGMVARKTLWRNNSKEGVQYFYYETGEIQLTTTFINDLDNGNMCEYYKSGVVATECKYVNGIRHGECVEYYESGKVAGTSTYKNGNLVGHKKCTDGRSGNETLVCVK